MAGVPNLWYTYHWWYVERLQVVRRKFLFYQKSKIDFDGKGKNKQAGVFEEVIDTIMLKITIFTHTSFFENSSSKVPSGMQNCF